VVGDRDRAEPALLRGREEDLDRGRAVGGVIGVHVQVAVDVGAPGEAAPQLSVRGRVVPPSRQLPVDALEVVGHHLPAAPLTALTPATPELLA
jgi:hypothetical protein